MSLTKGSSCNPNIDLWKTNSSCSSKWCNPNERAASTPLMHLRSSSDPNNNNNLELESRASIPALSHNVHTSDQNRASTVKRNALSEQMSTLEHDVEELRKHLMNEQSVRRALEQAMGRTVNAISPGHNHLTPQAKELIHEIKYLEEEVLDLEKHVLSLYRQFFDRCLSRSSSLIHVSQKNDLQNSYNQDLKPSPDQRMSMKLKLKPNQHNTTPKRASLIRPNSRHGSGLTGPATSIKGHFHSFDFENNSSHARTEILKQRFTKSNPSSLNEDGPRTLKEYLCYTPNKLSEELIHCMTAIYCKLADPALPHFGVPESPPTSCTSSSTSISSVQGIFSDGWSPRSKSEKLYEPPLIDPFQVKGSVRRAGAYSCMVEVPWICVDKERLSSVSIKLRDFRSMVEQLEKVDPSQLTHDEKLAFWINVHNALLMHAYLAYGISRNNLKRMTLLQRAAYKVGGRSINAHTIEYFILRCRSHRPTQWLQNLLLPGSKLKSNDERRSYTITKPEPLVCFALCCGGQSDPAVRVYTANNVHKELECARKEFLQASIGFQSDKKVLLPKILEWYVREASISSNTLLQWVSQYVDERDKETMLKCARSKPHKSTSHCIEWMAYNFNFRYIFDRNLAIGSTSHYLHH